MPKITMLDVDWWKTVKNEAKPKYITWESQQLTVVVDFPKEVYEQFGTTAKGKNDDLDSKVSKGGRDVYHDFVANMVTHVQEADKELEKIVKDFQKKQDARKLAFFKDSLQKRFEAKVQQELKGLDKRIEKGIVDAYDDWKKVNKEYRNYKIRTTVKVGGKVASIGFSIGRLVGTSGADVLAWRSLVSDTIGLVGDMAGVLMSTESHRKMIETQLKAVKTWHALLKDGKAATASEVGLALFKVAVGTDGMVTLKSLSENVSQYNNKILALEKRAQNLGAKAAKAQNKVSDAQKNAPEKLEKQLGKLETMIDKLLEQLFKTNKQVVEGKKWSKGMAQQINEMKKAKNVSHLDTCIKGIESLGDAISGGMSWADLSKNSSAIAKTIGSEAVSLIKNLESWEDERKALAKSA